LKKVKEIMTRKVVTVDGKMDVASVARMMDDKGIGSVMVKSDDALGILTERDIIVRCVAKGLDPAKTAVGSIMSSPLISAGPDTAVVDAAKLMVSKMIRRLPIVEGKELKGIVTTMDMVRDVVSKGKRKEDSLIYVICDYERF